MNIKLNQTKRPLSKLLQITNVNWEQPISPLFHVPQQKLEKPKTVNYQIRTTSPEKLDLIYDCLYKVQKVVPGATYPKKLRYTPKKPKQEITFEHRLAYIKSLGSSKLPQKSEEIAENYFKMLEIQKIVMEKQQQVGQNFENLIKNWQDLNGKKWPQRQDLHEFD